MKKWKTGNTSDFNSKIHDNEDIEDITENLLEYSDDVDKFTDLTLTSKIKKKKPWNKKRKAIVFSCLGLVLVLIIVGVVYAFSIWSDPMGQFDSIAQQVTIEPASGQSNQSNAPTPSASENPYNELVSKADFSILDKIVNIMLIGVDYAPERETWKGKHAYHADVMIVLAINKQTGKVDMISLPRDTYAKIPDVDGIYKLNASIDCGGGWPKPSGFEKVCQAASWMLGGLEVKYYYAVDMSAVKGLVNSIDGVDFDLDIDFELQGRKYTKGTQHMDGQAVLDYLRVRKELGSESGDLNRIDRQKRMLVKIFEKLKSTNLLLKLPELLQSFNGSLYYNTTLAQTAGLAAFMYKVDSANIEMHSMSGTYDTLFNWRFVLTNQPKRVSLIKQIYGVTKSQYKDYTLDAARILWENIQAPEIIKRSTATLEKIKKKLDADAKLPVYVAPSPSPSTSASKTTKSLKGTTIPKGYRQYDSKVWDLYNKAIDECTELTGYKDMEYEALNAANTKLKADVDKLCTTCSVAKTNWTVIATKDNEIKVDFN
jgi:LCP family protein required for cell wall assembly